VQKTVHTYQIGDLVTQPRDHAVGAGRVVAADTLFGQTYLEVYFPTTGQVVRRPAGDFEPWGDPFDRLAAARGSPASARPGRAFLARLIARQLQALMTHQGVLSAANFRITPLPHQILAVDFVLGQFKPRCLIADEVGLGKTIEAAMVYEELKLRGLARRVLVVAPSGLTHQWQQELEQKFGEEFVIFDRQMLDALRHLHGQEANLWQQHDRIITSIDFIKPRAIRPDLSSDQRTHREGHNREVSQAVAEAGWDVVIVDEAHKLSKHADGTETARYKIGSSMADRAPVFLLLTATPHQGDAGRFFHLLNLVDPFAFATPKDLAPDRVRQIMVRNRKRAAVDAQGHRLFKQRITTFYPVDRSGPAHAVERELYERVTEYVAENYDLALQRNDRAFGFLMILYQRMVTSSSQAIRQALSNRLGRLRTLQGMLPRRRGTGGAGQYAQPSAGSSGQASTGSSGQPSTGSSGRCDFDEEAALDESAERVLEQLQALVGVVDEAGLQQEMALIEALLYLAEQATTGRQDAKLKALLRIVDEVCHRHRDPTTRFLVFTEFVATQEYLAEALRGCGYEVVHINGRVKPEERVVAREAFRTDAQFMVSTDAGGEGVNLQFCHVLVNYDLPWNPMRLEQRIGRLDRIGQEHDVLVFNMLVEDTVEDRVRQVLERKLALIREQFGEDRLADILSTLQDDFNFDRIFIDAVRRREAEAAELEALAQRIYERAKAILESDDLLLPQAASPLSLSGREAGGAGQESLVEISPERVRGLVECYLEMYGEQLDAYARRPGVYYFDLPTGDGGGTKAHYAHVVFDRALALEDDSLDFFHINHPTVRQILERLETPGANDADGALAYLHVATDQAPVRDIDVGQGLWALYSLKITNDEGLHRAELLSLFVDRDGESHPRLARWLSELDPMRFSQGYASLEGWDLPALRRRLDELAETMARERFLAERVALGQQLAREREKAIGYFEAQETAARQIAIDNIRQARLADLYRRRQEALTALQRRGELVPDLRLEQVAVVEVGRR
jgi:superfamily II DNA or RNA helicase/predicted transcriptional regulator